MARPVEDINKDYTNACAVLGDLEYKKSLIEKDIRTMLRNIRELNKEGIRAKAKETPSEQPAAEAQPTSN